MNVFSINKVCTETIDTLNGQKMTLILLPEKRVMYDLYLLFKDLVLCS
jgi:hypothetical protein